MASSTVVVHASQPAVDTRPAVFGAVLSPATRAHVSRPARSGLSDGGPLVVSGHGELRRRRGRPGDAEGQITGRRSSASAAAACWLSLVVAARARRTAAEKAAPHQEAAERVHAVHEGDEVESRRRVHAQGVGRHQPDSRPQGIVLSHVIRLANSGFGHSRTPSPPFPSPPFPPFPPPSLSPGVPPPKPGRGLRSAVSSPSGVWGEAPADKRFGAYPSQKSSSGGNSFCTFS